MRSGPVVVMGVSGSGKSTVGAALAARLGVSFEDGDDLHPPANVDKMARGEPLDDADRWPWLDLVGDWLAGHSGGGVVACSALKRRYRDRLREQCAAATFVHLAGRPELIEERHRSRSRHFMASSMLPSQLDALEPLGPDERGLTVDVEQPIDEIVAECVVYLGGESTNT